MKKKIQTNFRFIVLLAIVIILTIVTMVILGCKTEPEPCNLGAHLGIGETCTGTNCTLQDYRTEEQKLTFPKAINRYGKESNYTSQQLRTTADNIVAGYNTLNTTQKNNLMSKVSQFCVTNAQNGYYTWDGSIFGIHYLNDDVEDIAGMFSAINSIPHAYPVAGLQ